MQFQEVEVREDKVVIIGYASTPTLDSYNTIIPVEVVQAWLGNYQKNPVILLQHDWDKPIWRAVSREVDLQGRKVTAEITKNTDGIMENIKDGLVKGFSIWFDVKGRNYIDTRNWKELSEMTDDEKENVPYQKIGRRFTEIEIRELSVVSVPSNPDTLFTMKRAFKKFFTEYETRSVAKEERILLSDESNPFIKQNDVETAWNSNENDEIEQEIITDDTTDDTETTENETPQEEIIDNLQPVSENIDDWNDGETPSTTPFNPESNDQDVAKDRDEEESLKATLEEERKLNNELLAFVEQLSQKYTALEARLGSIPVNKPNLYQRNVQADPLVSSMIKAKQGF